MRSPRPTLTVNDQLRNPANFKEGSQLYLVRCNNCPDSGDRGRENYMPAAATGTCAWCGWSADDA